MSYTKTVWEDLPSTNTPLNATNLNNIEDGIEDADLRIEDIDDRVTDNEQDIIQINNMLDMFNDTSGSDWKAMMKNKIDYCIDNINTTKTNAQAFVNGGWQGVNFGFGLFSKIGDTYQLEWFTTGISYYCRKLSNGTYDYHISVERGSNSNGYYIKYADGTLICYGTKTGTTTYSTYFNYANRSPDGSNTALQITFPYNFVDTNISIQLTPTYSQGNVGAVVFSKATSNFRFVCFKPTTNTNTNYGIDWVAIGRWK